MPRTKTGTSAIVAPIGFDAQEIFGKDLADPLDHQQRSALVIRHVLTFQTIAGAQVMERAIRILDIRIGLAEREVQRDPLLVG